MVLAAGLGSRLRPLTDLVPKALVPIGDRPMLALVAERLRAAGCERIVANAHHHADAIVAFCAGEKIEVSREEEILGTAGGLERAASLLGEGDVLVHNGDVLVDLDLAALASAHRAHDAAATLAITTRAAREGNVGVDGEGRIVRLRSETFFEGEMSGGEFTGVHVVSARVREALPAKGCLVGDVYMPRLRELAKNAAKHADLYVYNARDFVDVGSIEGYLRANVAWLGERASFVGEGAYVDPRVVLDRVVVGSGACVEGEGIVSRVVVWPDAIANAPLAGAVVTPRT
jgi:mannose-1-phosphate guanylyltransferase